MGLHLSAAASRDLDQVRQAVVEASRIQQERWDMAVENACMDMNSDVAALYIESVNEIIAIQSLRVAVGLQARVPNAIWVVLFALVGLGMVGVGYQTAIAGSRRSWSALILALAFSMVIVLIAALDNPQSRYLGVSQQPLADFQALMAPDLESPEAVIESLGKVLPSIPSVEHGRRLHDNCGLRRCHCPVVGPAACR